MKSTMYVNTETLKRDLTDAELSLCLIEPLCAIIKNRNDESFDLEVSPLIRDLIKEELSGRIVVNSETYEVWHYDIGKRKFFIFLV